MKKVAELIAELQTLPPESEVTEISGWQTPVIENGRETIFSRGITIRIMLPQKRVKSEPDFTP